MSLCKMVNGCFLVRFSGYQLIWHPKTLAYLFVITQQYLITSHIFSIKHKKQNCFLAYPLSQRFSIILFQNILRLKEFHACKGCFELFTRMKKGSGTRFCCSLRFIVDQALNMLNVDNIEWSYKNLGKMISADVKANKNNKK